MSNERTSEAGATERDRTIETRFAGRVMSD